MHRVLRLMLHMCALLSYSSTGDGFVWQVSLPEPSRLFLGVQGKAICHWHVLIRSLFSNSSVHDAGTAVSRC